MPAILSHSPVVQATITNFFFFAGLNCFVLLPLYIQGLGSTDVGIGVVMGLYSTAGIVCQPLVGAWMDVIGRRQCLTFGAGAVLATELVSLATTSVVVFGILRLVQGIGFSAFFIANYTQVLDMVPVDRRGWALGIYGVSGLMATALAPMAGEWVVRWFGFRALFLLAATLSAAAVVLVWASPRQPRRHVVPGASLETIRASWEEVFRLHILVTLFFGLGAGAIITFMPTFAESLGVTTLSLFYTGYAGAAMLVRVAAGGLIDTRGRRAVIVPCMLIQAMATAILAALGLQLARGTDIPIVPFLVLGGLLAGGAHGFLYPGLAALVADVTPPDRRSAAVGVFSSAVLAGNAFGAFAGGYLAHWLGYGEMWAALALILAIGYGLSVRLEEAPQRLPSGGS